MKKKISVIITVRGVEPYLNQTIKNIRNKAGCKVEIVCVFDGTEADLKLDADQIVRMKHPVGVGGARHAGIEKAENEIIFLTDSHMDFSQDFGKVILQHHSKKNNVNDLCCGCCVPLVETGGKLFWNNAERCTGARFNFISDEPGGERWVMSGKWAAQKPGKIGCVYGACYSFRKSHYHSIGAPLQLLTGWGMDEEYLSSATWLSGGRVILLNYDAGHLFRARPSFTTGKMDAFYRQLNRVRYAELLPANEKDKKAMNIALALNSISADRSFDALVESDMGRDQVKRALDLWLKWDWTRLEKWIDRQQQPLNKRIEDGQRRRTIPITTSRIPLVQMRGVFYCPQCGRINTFRIDRTIKTATHDARYGRCGHCGLHGVKVHQNNFERINWRGQP
jgi:glycosyltransferase involved in cell wall biosynthesis/predicted RNA-binding Zn-ribbon protein involved in translation (DUF1610 family)